MDINTEDAKNLGIKEGDMVRVESLRGHAQFKAHVTDDILPQVVHMEAGWGGDANINFLTDDENLDPISGYPPFRSGLCRVQKA
jgi:anaerobic selenocysteine-containing dehydrogenase